jgi:hypothetical protein
VGAERVGQFGDRDAVGLPTQNRQRSQATVEGQGVRRRRGLLEVGVRQRAERNRESEQIRCNTYK